MEDNSISTESPPPFPIPSHLRWSGDDVTPTAPMTAESTGIDPEILGDLVLKLAYRMPSFTSAKQPTNCVSLPRSRGSSWRSSGRTSW
jgi:hypothetical protein